MQGASSSKLLGTYGDLPDSNFHTPFVFTHVSHFPTVETPINSKQGDFPIEYSSFSPEVKEKSLENFDFLASPKVVNWFRI